MSDDVALVALSPFFWKGIAITVASIILFIGTVYVLVAAVFGLRMGYLVTSVSFFAWMIIFSALWAFGAPGTNPHLGPRGYEPHWKVFAAGAGDVASQFEATRQYPVEPWREPTGRQVSEADKVISVMQHYMAAVASRQLEGQGTRVCEETTVEAAPETEEVEECFDLNPEAFVVEDLLFAQSGDTPLVGARVFYQRGGTALTVFARFDQGNVPKYSYAFLGASVFGFLVHLPFLDRAERRRKEILTGGAAPPWYGPA